MNELIKIHKQGFKLYMSTQKKEPMDKAFLIYHTIVLSLAIGFLIMIFT